jgi:uncharacterized membrane protein (UPF0182 family)
VVPIEESFLYVEPIYLIAENIQIPQLRRVIVAYGEQVAMEETLNKSLNEVFGRRVASVPPASAPQRAQGPQDGRAAAASYTAPETRQDLREARDLVRQARQALREGDFSTFGDRFDELEQLLERNEAPADTVQAMLRDMTAPLPKAPLPKAPAPTPPERAAAGR